MKIAMSVLTVGILVGGSAFAAPAGLESCQVAITKFSDLKWQSAAKADAKFKAALEDLQKGVTSENAAGAPDSEVHYSPADLQYTAPNSFSSKYETVTNVVRPSNLNAGGRESVVISWDNHDFSYVRLQIDESLNSGIPLRAILQRRAALPLHSFSVIGRMIETNNASTKVTSDTVGLAHFVCNPN